MAVYESLEYLFCYDNEKKEHSKLMSLYKRAHAAANRRPSDDSQTSPERQTLLHGTVSYDGSGETIPLQDVASHHLVGSIGHAGASSSDNNDPVAHSSQGGSLPDRGQQPSSSTSHLPNDTPNSMSSEWPDDGGATIQPEVADLATSAYHGHLLTAAHDVHDRSRDSEVEYDEFVGSDDLQPFK